jgi:hypothetical protein
MVALAGLQKGIGVSDWPSGIQLASLAGLHDLAAGLLGGLPSNQLASRSLLLLLASRKVHLASPASLCGDDCSGRGLLGRPLLQIPVFTFQHVFFI